MQYSVDILTEIYVLEIICLQPFRFAIGVLKERGVKGKTGMEGSSAGATDWLLKHSHLSYRSEARSKQHKVRNDRFLSCHLSKWFQRCGSFFELLSAVIYTKALDSD